MLWLSWFLSLALMGIPSPVRLQARPLFSFAPTTITLIIRIERAPENRRVGWVCAGATLETSSERPVEGADSPSVYTIEQALRDVSEDIYTCRAWLTRTTGLSASAPVTIVVH